MLFSRETSNRKRCASEISDYRISAICHPSLLVRRPKESPGADQKIWTPSYLQPPAVQLVGGGNCATMKEATSPRTLARAHPTSRTHYAMSAFAMTGAAAPAKIAAKYNLGRNSKALNAKGEYKWHPWI